MPVPHHFRIFLATLATAWLAACTTVPPEAPFDAQGPTTPLPEDESTLHVYQCDGPAIGLFVSPDVVQAYFPGERVELQPARAASGARYHSEAAEVWTRDDRARVRWRGREYRGCLRDEAREPRDDLGRRPVDFRGQGNEPGWFVEISRSEIRMLTDHGQLRTVTPRPEPQVDGDITRYRVATDATELSLELRFAECVDSMSGERFPVEVEAQLNGQRFTGCGRALVPWPPR